MASAQENNQFFNETKTYLPDSDKNYERTLFVTAGSAGTVTHQTMRVDGETTTWEDVRTYAAGEGDVLTQGLNHFRFVPSDSTTYFKYM
jgi:hypothetical protein